MAFTEEQVKAETARCLGCGASVVDPNKCIGCGICTTRCAFDAIHLHRDLPECSTMRSAEDKMKGILPYMIKRKIRIRRQESRKEERIMHELGIVFHTIRTIEEVAAEQGLTRVGSVTLELGEVSGAIPQELVSCWDWAVNRTELLRGAPLKIETLPAVTHCEGCGENYPTVRHGRTCPYCGSEKTWLLRGNEISIKEIEAI